MLFFAFPPLAVLAEVAVTTVVGTVVALATKDAYDKVTQTNNDRMTQSDDDQ
ncbi:hypothetical protein [Zoogloea oleivorans]|uniref:hypothetical protein n=1 Tax=Zoogloea oleivorans TaxID=1552750 RepID=UPI001651E284|nr:hypothetical protein [Zoogloea oleivorans]